MKMHLYYWAIIFALMMSLALGQQVEEQVRQLTRQLMVKQVAPSERLLEPWETLEMLKKCKELMPNGISQQEELSSDQALVDWWLNLDNYIEVSVLKPVKWCRDGNFMSYLIKFISRSYPNMVRYVDHHKKLQDAQCSGKKI